MKKALSFFFLIIILASCADTPQQIAETTIKNYLKEKLDDPSSYESVSFTEIKPTYLDFEYSSDENADIEKKKKDAEQTLWRWEMKKLTPSISGLSIENINDSILFYQSQKQTIDSVYRDALRKYEASDRLQDGWTIGHTFRAKNKFGAKIKKTIYFDLNKDFTVNNALDF
ncbi:MAG: hypothetical protein LBV71_13125 [Prevotella sp.]|jgi:hypothetical protein|nr:hypothetical protein [Prevotella sp.]